MKGAWDEELIIKTSMRALASIAFMVKWKWQWKADPEVGGSNPGEYGAKKWHVLLISIHA